MKGAHHGGDQALRHVGQDVRIDQSNAGQNRIYFTVVTGNNFTPISP
jgi:hypothetical protein